MKFHVKATLKGEKDLVVQKKGRIPWNKGLTKEDTRVAQARETYNKTKRLGLHKPRKKYSDEYRQSISKKKKELYMSGWESTCGRCKKYEYNSAIAGKIKVDGTWELKAARYLDSIGVTWSRNKKRFNYIKPDGRDSTYQPDFFVVEWNSYIEVKGYETDLDRAKWGAFPEKLIVWRKDFISKLED